MNKSAKAVATLNEGRSLHPRRRRQRAGLSTLRRPAFAARAALLAVVAVVAVVALPAFGQDFPTLAPGLWEMERVPDRAPGKQASPATSMRTTMCLDESVQREMFALGAGAMTGACSRHDLRRKGNRLEGDFVCDVGGSKMHSKSTIVLDGNTSYRTEIDTTYDPPFMGQTKTRMLMRARKLGPCKPGQRAGDVVMPNGHTMNMRDFMSGAHGTHGTITPNAPAKRTPQ